MNSTIDPRRKFALRVGVLIFIITLLLPWLVGAYMKIYLDSKGAETIPWAYFLDLKSLPLLLIMSFWWGLPMVAVAYFAFFALLNPGDYFSYKDTVLIILITAVAGFAGMVKAFLPIFKAFDPMYAIVPVFFYYFHWILVGFILGLLVAYIRVAWRKFWHKN